MAPDRALPAGKADGRSSGSARSTGKAGDRQSRARSAAPATSDSRQIHTQLKTLRACGNEIRLAFLDALRTLYDRSLCYELGFSSYHQYCDRELGLPRSTAYEYLRAAQALDGLPQLRHLFREGELSWVQVRAITRVATADTEGQWIELAWAETVRDLLAEVREAQRTGRTAPRRSRHGLPNLLVDLGLKVSLEEKARIRAAFLLVGEALDGAGAGDADAADQRPPLVRWADAVLAGAIPVRPLPQEPGVEGGTGCGQRATPAQTIVYHACPECRQSTVETSDGRVSVTPERILELAPHAKRVEIPSDDEPQVDMLPAGEVDAPNTAKLSRQVLHRDGLVCANPACGRRHDLQAHHRVFRANGGRTVLSNEVAVCSTCHALIHAGLLDLSGCPDTGITWTPRPLDPAVKIRDAEALRERVRDLIQRTPEPNSGALDGIRGRPIDASACETANGHAVLPAAGQPGPRFESPRETRDGDRTGPPAASSLGRQEALTWEGAVSPARVRDLAYGLRRFGFTRAEGEELLGDAIVDLIAEAGAARVAGDPPLAPPTDEELLLRALRGRAAVA